MDIVVLRETIAALLADNKGLLAMDESTPTCDKRFAKLGIPETEEARRAYRELIVTAPKLGEFISGAILFDETIHQSTTDGTSFIEALVAAGIVPGIKVDAGAIDLPNFTSEKITEGLDKLSDRLQEYADLGARFAKWRAVIVIDEKIPSDYAIQINAQTLARYAALCQQANIVPIVEPEVLMDGSHTLAQCQTVTEKTLQAVFAALKQARVDLTGILLKPNMILPGLACAQQESVDKVAEATIECFLRCVPSEVPGIAFLSGGQPFELATERLNAMNARYKASAPWAITFSYSRAIQEPALKIWHGKSANIKAAQQALTHRALCNSAARAGLYNTQMENTQHGK